MRYPSRFPMDVGDWINYYHFIYDFLTTQNENSNNNLAPFFSNPSIPFLKQFIKSKNAYFSIYIPNNIYIKEFTIKATFYVSPFLNFIPNIYKGKSDYLHERKNLHINTCIRAFFEFFCIYFIYIFPKTEFFSLILNTFRVDYIQINDLSKKDKQEILNLSKNLSFSKQIASLLNNAKYLDSYNYTAMNNNQFFSAWCVFTSEYEEQDTLMELLEYDLNKMVPLIFTRDSSPNSSSESEGSSDFFKNDVNIIEITLILKKSTQSYLDKPTKIPTFFEKISSALPQINLLSDDIRPSKAISTKQFIKNFVQYNWIFYNILSIYKVSKKEYNHINKCRYTEYIN